MLTVDLSVPGAHCGVCRGVILKVLLATPGVHGAEVDLREKRATVLVDPAVVDAQALCDHLRDAGYPATPVGRPATDAPTRTQEPPNPAG